MAYKSEGRKGHVWRELRKKVLDRDSWTCQLCGHPIADGQPGEVDHITPRAHGGGSKSDNLRAVHGTSSPCYTCSPQGRCCNQERKRGTTVTVSVGMPARASTFTPWSHCPRQCTQDTCVCTGWGGRSISIPPEYL